MAITPDQHVIAVLGQHRRDGFGPCSCGWNVIGRSHMKHVDQALQDAKLLPLRTEGQVKAEALREVALGPIPSTVIAMRQWLRERADLLEQS